MFSEDIAEQELYHATATVTSLLLEMGEVGKLFSSCGRQVSNSEEKSEQSLCRRDFSDLKTTQEASDLGDVFVPAGLESKSCEEENKGEESEELPSMQDIKLEDSSPKDTGTSSAMLISDDETKDDTSVSSYSVLSTGSHELDDKLQCEDISDDTVLVRSDDSTRSGGRTHGGALPDPRLPHSTSIDKDWAITFEQFLASVLTEHALVRYFEKPVEAAAIITNAKNVRKAGRPLLSTSDYEISISG